MTHRLRGPATGRFHQAGRCMPWAMGMRSSREAAQATRRRSRNWTAGTDSPRRSLRHIRTVFAFMGASDTCQNACQVPPPDATMPSRRRHSPMSVQNANVAERVARAPFGPEVMLTTGSEHSAAVVPSQAGLPALVSVPW